MRTLVLFAVLPVMLSGCAIPDELSSSAQMKKTLRETLQFQSPNKAIGLHYARGQEARFAPECSENMRPYAALRLQSDSEQAPHVVALGKRDGNYVAETPMGENRYGKSYVSVGTARDYAGRTAVVNYRLEF